MPITYDFSIEGMAQFVFGRNNMIKMTSDFREPFAEIGEDFKANEKVIFDRQGRPLKFRALTPRYKEYKQKVVGQKPILQFWGRLMESLIGRTSDTIRSIKPKEARFGTKVPYAQYHQKGTSKMVARPPIQITAKRRKKWFNIHVKFLDFVVNKRLFPKQI